MKKVIIVLLVAVLVAGFAFADFSGDAYIQFNADLDAKDYGFVNGTESAFSFEFASEKAEILGEEDIHVELAASAKLVFDYMVDGAAKGSAIWASSGDSYGMGLLIKFTKARIAGSNWYVDILGVQNSYNYASAAVKKIKNKQNKDVFGNLDYLSNNAASYSVAYAKAPGLTIGYADFVASFGFNHTDAEGTAFSATLQTPEFKFSDDAIAVQVAAEASKKASENVNAGASAKATVAIQDIKVGFAADFGLEGIGGDDDAVFQMDARADFGYKFVDVNVYTYVGKPGLKTGAVPGGPVYKDFYLEAKAAFDLNEFEVPVKVTVSAANIVDNADAEKGIDLAASADFAKDAISAGASFGFNTKTSAWNVNAYGAYAAEKFTAGANVKVAGADELSQIKFGVFAESDAIVKGATFGLNYGYDPYYAMAYGGSYVAKNAYNTNNFAGDDATVGTVSAYCMIAF